MADDIINYVRPQTDAEIEAIAAAQKMSHDIETARLATLASAIIKLKALGLTDNEISAIIG